MSGMPVRGFQARGVRVVAALRYDAQHRAAMQAKKQTEAAFHQLAQVMRDLDADLGWRLKDSPRIPAA